MKKMMMIIAVAAMAVGANAAQIDWSVTINGASTAGIDKSAYVAYFVDSSTWDSYVDGNKLKSDALTKALDKAGFDTNGTKIGTGSQGFNTEAASVGYKIILADSAATKWAELSSGTAYSYDPESSSGTPVSATTTGARILGKATSGNLSWGTVVSSSVPEPTSGLLLLMGMAGLALRRKQK